MCCYLITRKFLKLVQFKFFLAQAVKTGAVKSVYNFYCLSDGDISSTYLPNFLDIVMIKCYITLLVSPLVRMQQLKLLHEYLNAVVPAPHNYFHKGLICKVKSMAHSALGRKFLSDSLEPTGLRNYCEFIAADRIASVPIC